MIPPEGIGPHLAVIAASIRPKPQRRRKDGTLIPVRSYSWTAGTYHALTEQMRYVKALRARYWNRWIIEVSFVRKSPKQLTYLHCYAPEEAVGLPLEEKRAAFLAEFPNAEVRPHGFLLHDAGDLIKLHMLERIE